MDWVLYLAILFVLTFLILVAFLYVFRPSWILMDQDTDTPCEVDMWRAFVIGLGGAVLMVCFFALSWQAHYKCLTFGKDNTDHSVIVVDDCSD